MTMPIITPEMISDDLYRNVCVSPRSAYAHDLNAALDDPAIRAVFVARAIELGEASPAAYCTRWNDTGELIKDCFGKAALFAYQRESNDGLLTRDEHWKGQTE